MNQKNYPSELKGARVLVTGATGFTGAVLVRKLVAAGAEVNAIARASSKLAALTELPITWHRGNVYDQETVAKACQGVQYIFHVAAAFRAAKIPDDEYRLVHVESTKLLAEAARANESFKRFIHVSTMGVHGHIENPPGDENSPYAPGDIYQDTKLEAELWIREFAQQQQLPLTVIRPTAIFGPEDRRLFKIFKMTRLPFFPILGRGRCLYHLIHVEDLADAMLAAAVSPQALGEAFLIGNECAIPLEEMAKIIANEYRSHLRVVRIPVWPFFVLAGISEAVCRPLGIEPLLYRRRVAFYTKDRSFSVKKMLTLLDFTPSHSNESGLRETARWYVDHDWIRVPELNKTQAGASSDECTTPSSETQAARKEANKR